MNPEDIANAAYARQRETEERAAADAATIAEARNAHFAMAERYANRAWSLDQGRGFCA